MKKFEKTKGFILGVVLTLVASITIPVFAENIEVFFNSANIKINGEQTVDKGQSYALPDGTEVPFSIIYKGTTYLPLRKIGDLYNKDIVWDGITSTISINDKINDPASKQAKVTCNANYVKESNGTYTITVTASGGSGNGKYAIGYGKISSGLSYFIPVDDEGNPLYYHKFTGVQPGSTWYFGAFKQGDSTYYNSPADIVQLTAPTK